MERNHSLDHLFDCKDIDLKFKPKKKKVEEDSSSEEDSGYDTENVDADGLVNIVRPSVVCTDPQEFVYKAMMDRNLDPESTTVKVGLDDGQKIFKVRVPK